MRNLGEMALLAVVIAAVIGGLLLVAIAFGRSMLAFMADCWGYETEDLHGNRKPSIVEDAVAFFSFWGALWVLQALNAVYEAFRPSNWGRWRKSS